MKTMIAAMLSLAAFGATHAGDLATTIPPAVINDPAPDTAHPPRSAQVLVPSHGKGMNGLFYLAGGKVTAVTLPSDHAFQDHRIALAADVLNWLQTLPAD